MERSRRPLRLKGYDYSRGGYYFLTICVKNRRCMLGQIVGADVPIGPQVRFSPLGQTVHEVLKGMPQVEKFVIMPNHLHLIVRLESGPMGTSAPTGGIPALVRYLKRQVTQRCGEPIWQRSYYDHIIRDENDYLRVWAYIDANPAQWAEDEYYIAQENGKIATAGAAPVRCGGPGERRGWR